MIYLPSLKLPREVTVENEPAFLVIIVIIRFLCCSPSAPLLRLGLLNTARTSRGFIKLAERRSKRGQGVKESKEHKEDDQRESNPRLEIHSLLCYHYTMIVMIMHALFSDL